MYFSHNYDEELFICFMMIFQSSLLCSYSFFSRQLKTYYSIITQHYIEKTMKSYKNLVFLPLFFAILSLVTVTTHEHTLTFYQRIRLMLFMFFINLPSPPRIH
ncbi:hypothetical protein BDF20DRAFT_517843 [Mycotypha africana]|uniref:uncharacterized protein n=1 Tax=Mycotypha africana TaxID=64632 RepID=UPI002301770A|nr:uncharacterized protein BDF20DRAFT_517843 [Mycotypha africana]KAI8979575.1 hypothetical protein BDF20DRAFT_517843 [Mycotypha africana]